MAPASLLDFGALLKRYRRAAHLTQAELAESAGFSVTYVSKLERGARLPQRTTVTLLADALALSPTERAALETALRLPPDRRLLDRRPGSVTETALPIGAFLGATPAGPLVGREAELGAVAVALAAVASGQGRLLALFGEPGIGKTRLAQEITVRARARGFRVLTGRCYEPQQSVAWYPFLEALAMAAAGIGGEAHSALSAQWPEVARLLPDHLDHPESAQTSVQIDDRAAQQQLFWQVASFLRALADQAPLALLLDDLHWADSATLDLLQHLARHTRDHRILLVATYRDLEVNRTLAAALHDLGRDELVERIVVRPLTGEETTALIGATLGAGEGAQADAAAVSPHLARLIQQRSEGNAFFTRQLTRALQEQGDLLFEEGEWRLSASVTLPAPESIRALIGQRLARLMPLTQDVLREASVLGQDFAFTDLHRMGAHGEQEVEEALEEAARAGVVREGQPDHYYFNHALTLDTLAADLSTRRKRRLHRAAADAIERSPDHERRGAELAYHLLAADEGARALPYALLAGDQAEAVYAHAEAEGHYRGALEVAQEVGAAPREAEALEKLGRTVALLGRHREAAACFDRALRVYQELGDKLGELRALGGWLDALSEVGREQLDAAVTRARAILARIEPANTPRTPPLGSALGSALAAAHSHLGWILWTAGLYEDAQTDVRQAVELARASGDEAELAEAQFVLIASGGIEATAAAFEETLALAERSGRTNLVVTSHNMAAFMYTEQGDFARALAHMEQALAAAEQRQDPRHLAWQLKNFSRFLFDAGDWRRRRAVFARADALMREADRDYGETWQSADMSIHRGVYALVEGREEEGRRLLEEAMQRIVQMGPVSRLHFPACMLAEADLLAGHSEEARARLMSLLGDRQTFTPIEHGARGARLLLAWAEMALGRHEEAETRLATVLTDAPPFLRVDALRIQGLLAMAQQRWDVGIAALEEALKLIRAMPYPYAELKTLWVYGRLEAARGNAAAAEARFRAALALCDHLGEGWYRRSIEYDLQPLSGGTSR
jgi:tetratricopeptide (TPR) repeat protein